MAADRSVHAAVDPVAATVLGDPARLRQLVMIMVDNGMRHVPDGGSVAVRVRVADGDGEHPLYPARHDA